MFFCQILSAIILILLIATLVIKEHENRNISFFVPSVVLALLSNVFSVYDIAFFDSASKKADNMLMSEVEPFFSLVVYLTEALSLSFFCLFLKQSLYKGKKSGKKILSALSFIVVPLIGFASFLPASEYWYMSAFLFQAILIILFVAFSRAERNVCAWFITGVTVFALSLVISYFYIEMPLNDIGIMLMYLTVFIGYEVQLKNDMLRRELELSHAKTSLLMRQISPHFIFNSLQVIISLCDSNAEKVKPALENFSGYLRGNLESITNNEPIPFSKELEHTKEYLDLEQYGEGRAFSVNYELQVTDFMVPPLILQPVVENAVQYGIGTRTAGGLITIETCDTPFLTLIRVKDDGSGKSTITEPQKNRQSVGMKNVRARLKALCGGDLIFESSKSGTTVTITIPKSLNEKSNGSK